MKYKYDYTLASRMGLFMYEEMATPSTESTLPPAKKIVKTSAKDVDKYSTDELITFLKEQNSKQNLGLLQEDYDKLKTERINGHSLLATSREEFQGLGLKFGPTRSLAKLAEDIRGGEQYIADSPFFGFDEADDTYDEVDENDDEADENDEPDELLKIEDLDITGQEADEYSYELPSNWTKTGAEAKLRDLCSAKIIRVNDVLSINKNYGFKRLIKVRIECKVTRVDDGKLAIIYYDAESAYKIYCEILWQGRMEEKDLPTFDDYMDEKGLSTFDDHISEFGESKIENISSLPELEKTFLNIRQVSQDHWPEQFNHSYRDIKISRDGEKLISIEAAIKIYRSRRETIHKNKNKE